MTDNELQALSERNRHRALAIISKLGITEAFANAGGEAHIVGSVAMGLMMTHRDIDIHAYTPTLSAKGSRDILAAVTGAAGVTRTEVHDLTTTDEACMEWHVWYNDEEGHEWQIDIIHILKGSRYDGYFERMAERIKAALTAETRLAILRLKAETPPGMHIMGIEYYQAVLRDGVRTWPGFTAWRKLHAPEGIIEWMP